MMRERKKKMQEWGKQRTNIRLVPGKKDNRDGRKEEEKDFLCWYITGDFFLKCIKNDGKIKEKLLIK